MFISWNKLRFSPCKNSVLDQWSNRWQSPWQHVNYHGILTGHSCEINQIILCSSRVFVCWVYSFSGTISWRMYPWFFPLFPLLPVDFPYFVVIYPSSCSAPTLLLLFESFLMFYILQFYFCVATPFLPLSATRKLSTLCNKEAFLALKLFIFSSCFIHVLSSDILFFIKTVHLHVVALFSSSDTVLLLLLFKAGNHLYVSS